MAVTGSVHVKLNGAEQPTWTRLSLRSGDELSFGLITGGARFYIAFADGIDVPVALGSRSTYPLGAMGGFHGRKLEAGDTLA